MTLRQTAVLLSTLAALGGTSSVAAAGQSQLPMPRVQIGAEVAFGSVDGGSETSPRVFVPRLTVNFSPRWALDVTADRYHRPGRFGEFDERMLLVQMRTVIAESPHGVRFSGLFGAGLDVTRYDFPAYEGTSYDAQTYGQPRLYPAESLSHRRPLILTGLNVSRSIGRQISVHGEIKLFPFPRFGFGARATAGVTAAIGRFPPAATGVALSIAPDRPVRVGERVWVTMVDGSHVSGVVFAATPASMTVAQGGRRDTLAAGSIARLDVQDTTTTARRRWMTIGGLAGLGLGLAMTASWVASNGGEGAEAFGIWGPGLATLGIVGGGLVGGEIDRRRSLRRTVYDISRPAVFVAAPVIRW
jgi:hypothetical protein